MRLPEAVSGPEVLDSVAVHEAPVPRRPVGVVAHHVQVQAVLHGAAVDGGDAAEVAELLVVVLVGSPDLVKVLSRPRLLGEGSCGIEIRRRFELNVDYGFEQMLHEYRANSQMRDSRNLLAR